MNLSNFKDIVQQHITKASVVYSKTPFSNMSPQRRGLLLEEIGKRIDNNPATKPVKKRSRASYDWFRPLTKERVECKSAQLSWNKAGWVVHFKNIKVKEFDKLVLCFYTPSTLEYYECHGKLSLYNQGPIQNSKGQCLVLHGGKTTPVRAVKCICTKLDALGSRMGRVLLV